MSGLIWAVLAAAGLAACATPTTMAPNITAADTAAEGDRQVQYVFDARLAEQGRLDDIGFKLFSANAELCPAKRTRFGMTFVDASLMTGSYRDAAIRAFGTGDGLVVTHVAAGGPADLAGVRRGDQIVALNGSAAQSGPQVMDILSKGGRQTFVLRRAGQQLTVAIDSVVTCAYEVVLADGQELNAYADGQKIFVTRAMLRLAGSDPELALVVAHELAHDAREHVQAMHKNSILAALGGAAIDAIAASKGIDTQGQYTEAAAQAGARYRSPEFEAEADYVGMYFLARAGFQTDGVENFWRKMAAEDPQGIYVKTDHPASASRYLAIAAASAEITRKRAAGEPLVPNERPR